ncbi:MAG: DUF1844 domain-containing protein [Verrucomicrobiota bacterium]
MSDQPETTDTPTDPQELAQRFVQFVMIQAQNVLYVLGKIPGPDGTAPQPNLEAAKMLIDQLDMIQGKTKGNLIEQEEKILKDTLSELKMAFVDASGGTPASMMPDRSPKIDLEELEKEQAAAAPSPEPEPTPEPVADKAPEPQPEPKEDSSDDKKDDDEDKKKFFKSYG